MIEVKEAKFVKPVNDIGGFYVWLQGSRDEIYGDAGIEAAKSLAAQNGWDHEGRASMGIPVTHGLTTYTRAYWFYERRPSALGVAAR